MEEIIAFQRNYPFYTTAIVSDHELLIEQEKNNLNIEIPELTSSIRAERIIAEKELNHELERLEQKLKVLSSTTPVNFFQKLKNRTKQWVLRKKLNSQKSNLVSNIDYAVRKSMKLLHDKTNRHQYLDLHFSDAVNQSCSAPLKELERKKRVVDEVNTFIYGALGEENVVKELEKLSDEYFLINDFTLPFKTAIYNRQENEYIKSIQIDHLLVSPAGIFLIETKNWNEASLNNLSLRSPVAQIKRTNFALFKILTQETTNSNKLRLNQHHWGKRKIPIRNLIILTSVKPKEEFQYVKILTVDEIIGYVKYFKPTFSKEETQEIANFLLNLISQK